MTGGYIANEIIQWLCIIAIALFLVFMAGNVGGD